MVFLKYLESLTQKIRKKFFFCINSSKDQIISFQLWEQDRFHLKSKHHFYTLRDLRREIPKCKASCNALISRDASACLLYFLLDSAGITLLFPPLFSFLSFLPGLLIFQIPDLSGVLPFESPPCSCSLPHHPPVDVGFPVSGSPSELFLLSTHHNCN